MTTKTTLVLVLVAGFAVIILCSIAGCGEVTTTDMPGDGAGGAAGSVELHGDGGAAGEMMKLDGSGTAGVGGAGGAGGAALGRPLGAGCSVDTECGSSICDGASHACCNGHADSCNTCVGGYLVSAADGASVDVCTECRGGKVTYKAEGTACGGAPTCGGPKVTTNGYAANSLGFEYRCNTGVCTQTQVVDCSTYKCPGSCPTGAPGCFTYDSNGVPTGHASCWCVNSGNGLCTQ
jgi:hypothetical protein